MTLSPLTSQSICHRPREVIVCQWLITWSYPRPTNSGVFDGLGGVPFIKMKRFVISLASWVGGYPQLNKLPINGAFWFFFLKGH